MNAPTMTKQIIIEFDVLTGDVDYKNPDQLTYIEALGMIEFAKMMIMGRYIEETNE
ncbi:hypothetical protein [Paenibacillus sp. Aloe-11]|uniref:hypothetical protein n=2 Tax=Paenibacillus TaxID=44249 RepID=UPI00024EFFAB|nr:hypothetical protein [Paenibacillus sp. Aloe-11]EHS59454.1 hypothetical protein WG8_0669 [Paenibacillus sp. Aloe-11]